MPTDHVPQSHSPTVSNTRDPTTTWAACASASPLQEITYQSSLETKEQHHSIILRVPHDLPTPTNLFSKRFANNQIHTISWNVNWNSQAIMVTKSSSLTNKVDLQKEIPDCLQIANKLKPAKSTQIHIYCVFFSKKWLKKTQLKMYHSTFLHSLQKRHKKEKPF